MNFYLEAVVLNHIRPLRKFARIKASKYFFMISVSFHKNNRKAPTSLPVISNVMIPPLSCGTSPFTLTGESIGKERSKAHIHAHAHVHIIILKSNCCHGLFTPFLSLRLLYRIQRRLSNIL